RRLFVSCAIGSRQLRNANICAATSAERRVGQESLVTNFEKIVRREIPADIVLENDDVLAFRDVNPQAPVHVLIVPKRVVPRLADATPADEALLGKLLLAARAVAEKLDLVKAGYRVVSNSG